VNTITLSVTGPAPKHFSGVIERGDDLHRIDIKGS
jgi:hypothetical protein